MLPIPKSLLIHSAILVRFENSEWQDSVELIPVAELNHIRFEPSSKLVSGKDKSAAVISARMFYDCTNSSPRNVCFEHGQFVIFGGEKYSIERVRSFYDDIRLHHIELELI